MTHGLGYAVGHILIAKSEASSGLSLVNDRQCLVVAT
jgi:hypothetical protein